MDLNSILNDDESPTYIEYDKLDVVTTCNLVDRPFCNNLLEQHSATNAHSFYVAFQLKLICEPINVIFFISIT
ncbi:hypothetical protein PS15p_211624 [Mucor circinelloides]